MKATRGSNIEIAATILREGGIVAIPTETVYGLAANALNAEGVTKIFEAKNRPQFDPLIVHTASIESAQHFVEPIPHWAKTLFKHFSPGPLTIVLKKSPVIPDIVTSGLPTVGIRIPAHPIALELLRRLDFPLAAPSANPFGFVSPTSAQHVADQLSDKIDYILDGGECSVGIESTIIGEVWGKPTIFRLGGTSIEEIESVIGKVEIQTSSSNPTAPGMLDSHYSPKQKVIIGMPKVSEDMSRIGVIRFSERISGVDVKQIVLSDSGELHEAARSIFGALRNFDETITTIYAELVPDVGLGRAINDRLKRAAA